MKCTKEKHLVQALVDAAASGPDLHDTALLLHHQDNQLCRGRTALGIFMQLCAHKTLSVKDFNRWVYNIVADPKEEKKKSRLHCSPTSAMWNEIRLPSPISAKKTPTLLGLRSVSDIRVCENREEQERSKWNVIKPCV